MDNVKRFLVTLICLAALLGGVCMTASAARDTRVDDLVLSAEESYTASIEYSGKESFHGHCGNMVSCQLFHLGINSWFVSNNGNDLFDYYAAMDKTSGGYYIKPYYLEDYSLQEALEHLCRYGTRDVYNILVGFQWTDTEAGSQYGHGVLINGIIDGTVYFVESFDFFLNGMHEEGSVVACSVEEFANYYAGWATYEGLIWFGNRQYADCCEEFDTDLIIEANLDIYLRSQPCSVGRNDCVALRRVAAGEQLHATDILINSRGNRFYRVADGDTVAFIPETAAAVVQVNLDALSLNELNIPRRIARGGAVKMAGQVQAVNTPISAVEITVSDMQGNVLLSARQDGCGFYQDLQKMSLSLDTQFLPEGAYLVQVYCECAYFVPAGQETVRQTERVRLVAQMMLVGRCDHRSVIQPVMNKVVTKKAGA